MGTPITPQKKTNQHQGHSSAPGKYRWLWCLMILFLLSASVGFPILITHAQTLGKIEIQPPQLDLFPIVSTNFRITSASKAIKELSINDLTLYENNQEVKLLTLHPVHQGAHFTLVINGSREFDLRDIEGISPFQKISAELSTWAIKRKFAKSDAWSLITNHGAAIRNTSSSEGWITALNAYQPNFRALEPDLVGLDTAIQSAKEWVVPFGVDKAILYITPPPMSSQIDQIRNLTQLAESSGIHISVWMIGDPYYLTNEQGVSLMDLASNTGGTFYYYTREEPLPNPEDILLPLGKFYTLTYESNIRETGTYPLKLQIALENETLTGEAVPFFINLAPPKPILVSPPASIIRQAPMNVVNPQDAIEPKQIELTFIIEFPDGYPREIEASRLYVNGRFEDQRLDPPFDRLVWDLTSITESGDQTIQVEVVDSLGLSSRTIAFTVPVEVVTPSIARLSNASRQQVGLWISGTILFAAFLILMIWAGKQFIVSPAFAAFSQSVFHRFRRPHKAAQPHSDFSKQGRLLPLKSLTQPINANGMIKLTDNPLTIGSDPKKANIVINNKEIKPSHARILIRNNHFYFQNLVGDKNSWFNYERMSSKSVELHPGDIIHLGNCGFRFTIIDEKKPLIVEIQKFEPEL
jgi:hypothetical protein